MADTLMEPLGAGWFLVASGTDRWRIAVADSGDFRWVFCDGQVAEVAVAEAATSSRAPAGLPSRTRARGRSETGVMAPMPATVLALSAVVGQTVSHGDVVIVLEAMKMELPLKAPRDGVVKAIHCATGDLVQPGVNLMEFA